MKGINHQTLAQRLKSYRNNPISAILMLLLILAVAITAVVTLFLIGYILVKGVPQLRLSLFAWKFTTENQSMLPAIFNTVIMTVVSLLIATPLGVFSAVYLTEYAGRGNKLVNVVRMTTETLSGIPSIVYGLFGMLCFNAFFGWSYSILSGACTMSIMILPLIMRTTEEALLAVPDSYREGSFGLGAGKKRTVFRIVLPAAVPGILSGIILGVGRIVGETAALIYTSGTVQKAATSLMDSGGTLSTHMYILANEGLHVNEAYATAVILLVVVVLINALSGLIAKRLTKG